MRRIAPDVERLMWLVAEDRDNYLSTDAFIKDLMNLFGTKDEE